MGPIRQKPHRLPVVMYRGRKAVSYTACIEGRKPVLNDTKVVANLLPLLTSLAQVHECLIPIYCFMPDHLHVIMLGQTDRANSKLAMDAFKQKAGFWLMQNRPDIVFQVDYHDHIHRTSEDWGHQLAYVYNNPVRAGLVAEPAEYPFTGSIGGDIVEWLRDASK